MVNPNYPVIEEQWGPAWTAAGASIPATRWVNMVDRTLSQASARRGKQYELDQPQAGEYSITLGSQDGVLDPTNTSGPYASRILPYQPYRRRAQWPPTANMLTPELATAGEGFSAGSFPASWGITVPSGTITGTVAALGSGQAWQGANVFSFAIQNGTAVNSGIFRFDTLAIRPGKKVTFSLYVANTTASTSTSVLPHIDWLAADGSALFGSGSATVITGSSGTPAWQRLSVTATAPTTGNVYGMRIGANLGATATAASTIVVDGLQVEWGSAATTWASPGTWYPIFSGFTERWPTTWAEGGTYGQVQPTAVDSFALLSQVQLKEIFLEEIDSHSPRFCFPMDDAPGSTSLADTTGNNPAAPLAYSKSGTGGWTFGNSVTSATASGGYIGATGTVVTSNPSNPGSATASAATVLDLPSVGITGPRTTAWTRMIAFRTTTLPTDISVIWEGVNVDGGNGGTRLYLSSSGGVILYGNPRGGDVGFARNTAFAAGNYADGNWHLVMFGWDAGNRILSVDGTTVGGATPTIPEIGFPVDYVGATYTSGTRTAVDVFKGDLAFVTEFPSLLSTADAANLYSAWRNAAGGDTSAARYARILRYSGFTGPSNVGTGLTSSMGPALDLGGTDVMSALNSVVDTENGEHFVAADGTVTFRGRNVRYNALTPALTFGDGPGELPFEDLQLDFDSTHLSNVVTVTQTTTGANFTAQDSASVAAYYTRTMTRSLNTTSAGECQDAADYFVSRYKQPLTRVQGIKVHPSAAPSLWPSLLALELGTRVRIIRRPPGAPTVTVDCFVEQIQWDMDSTNEAFVTLQCSPIDPTPYTQFSNTLAQFDQAVFAY